MRGFPVVAVKHPDIIRQIKAKHAFEVPRIVNPGTPASGDTEKHQE
jgi:hypothetical protein